MPKVILPDGSVLVGHKADEYIKIQKKAEKELKGELKADLKQALKTGAAGVAKAIKADIKAASSPAAKAELEASRLAAATAVILADPELFWAEVLRKYNAEKAAQKAENRLLRNLDEYRTCTITRKADLEGVDNMCVKSYINTHPSVNTNNLYIEEVNSGGHISTFVLEVHPSLIKNGKVTVEIPIGSVAIVEHKRVNNTYKQIICAIDK